ncbi:MAG: hypothetical protein PWQ60_527 [Thermoanaerobacteraceae bacterium]|nr:hypothetical protein [Thermoanaerobacteraceae bacterium]
MVKAMVVGTHIGTVDLLQRRVGGILKDIAKVDVCWFEDLDKTDADIYISYAHGMRFPLIKEKFKNTDKKVIGAELTILPVGVRMLNAVPKGQKMGVVAEHLRCANYFLSEIIRTGVLDYEFSAGPISAMKDMDVDVYAIPEELIGLVKKGDNRGKSLIQIPRTITPMCAAELINAALEV